MQVTAHEESRTETGIKRLMTLKISPNNMNLPDPRTLPSVNPCPFPFLSLSPMHSRQIIRYLKSKHLRNLI